MDYRTLNALPAEAFLTPERFSTVNDTVAGASKQYAEGLRVGAECETIHLSTGGTWGATMKNGASLTSYEGIGYHANTAALWRGFLDSGAKIVVHRYINGKLTSTVLKEARVAA